MQSLIINIDALRDAVEAVAGKKVADRAAKLYHVIDAAERRGYVQGCEAVAVNINAVTEDAQQRAFKAGFEQGEQSALYRVACEVISDDGVSKENAHPEGEDFEDAEVRNASAFNDSYARGFVAGLGEGVGVPDEDAEDAHIAYHAAALGVQD